MGDCCEPGGYDEVFDDQFARRMMRRYHRRGLSRPARAMVDFLTAHDLEGASILEIGGGMGEIQVALLQRGARTATNLEISRNYEEQAGHLLDGTGLRDRVQRRFLDIAQSPDEVESADVVVLHRVVCCYPDYERLLGAAASKARRFLVFSHPPANVVTRAVIGWDNTLRKFRGNDFRAFVHPPDAMLSVVTSAGLRPAHRWRGMGWVVVGLER